MSREPTEGAFVIAARESAGSRAVCRAVRWMAVAMLTALKLSPCSSKIARIACGVRASAANDHISHSIARIKGTLIIVAQDCVMLQASRLYKL